MEAKVYNQKGKEEVTITLNEDVFGLSWNADLVAQVVNSLRQNRRRNTAHSKDRSDVRGGGIKPWRQKGTGRARHGSIRSPLWVGGGVTFGPRNDKNYDRKVNKKMKSKALFTVLSKKLQDGEIVFVKSLEIKEPKTKDAKEIVANIAKADKAYSDLATKKNNAALIATDTKDKVLEKSFNNFGNIEVEELRNLNVIDVLNSKYIIIENPEESLKIFDSKKILVKSNK